MRSSRWAGRISNELVDDLAVRLPHDFNGASRGMVFVPGNRLQFANLAMERIEVNRLEMDFHGDLELPEGMFVGWSGITYLHPD